MACKIVWADNDERVGDKRYASHAAVVRTLNEGESVMVQELNGTMRGFYREVTNNGRTYSVSGPLMDF